MANKIIKYTLESDGTSPNYIGDGGYYPKPNGGSHPKIMILLEQLFFTHHLRIMMMKWVKVN